MGKWPWERREAGRAEEGAGSGVGLGQELLQGGTHRHADTQS